LFGAAPGGRKGAPPPPPPPQKKKKRARGPQPDLNRYFHLPQVLFYH
jgi:hypothetical protein